MKKLFLFLTVCLSVNLWAQVTPEPAGRWVVDDAGILSSSTEYMLTQLLEQEEDSSGNQVLVMTIASLDGETIEACANRLFNRYGIGDKHDNNGVLLLVAYDEHKIRIEVGYGLEPYLTDLTAKHIIDYDITPEFKKGDFDQGTINGVKSILGVIHGTYTPRKKMGSDEVYALVFLSLFLILFTFLGAKTKGAGGYFTFAIVLFIFGSFIMAKGFYAATIACLLVQVLVFIVVRMITDKKGSWLKSSGGGGWSSGGGGGWGGGGGGFSGGGGSSGGGGASGGW